jgi:hypothetical protein
MANHKSRKHKTLKWVGGIIGVLLILVIGAALYFSAKWKPILTEKIKEGVYNGSHRLYRVDFKDIRINLFTGSATLDSVRLMPDTAVFNQLKPLKLAPVHLFQVTLNKLQLNRVSILKAYFDKEVDMNAIILDNPSINIIHNKVPKRPGTVKDDRSLYEQISKTLKLIHVKHIRIVDADLDYINGTTMKPLNSVKHLNINVRDLLIDSVAQFDTTRFYYTKDISFDLAGYKSLGKDKMYTIKVDSVCGSTSKKFMSVKGLKVVPMYPDLAFTRKYKYGKDRYDLDFDKINFNGVDFAQLNDQGSLYARSIVIGPAKAGIFVNRELPPPPNLDKGRNFPHMALKRLPIPAQIDTIRLKNIDVAYTEYNPISMRKGTIYIDNLTGNITNVTNDSTQLGKNHYAIAKLHAMMMKTSRIDIQINFNLTAKNGAFNFKGEVAPMNLRTLNTVGKNMGLVEIESGRMQRTAFDIKANLNGSSGTVHFLYSDLKVKLLKEGEDGEAPKKKGFLSFLANTLLIKDANPTKDDPPRTANVTFERTPSASFFNLLWKSVFIGMREIIGLGIIPVKTPEQALEKINDKKQERKEKREKRLEERKTRREKKAQEKREEELREKQKKN